MSLLSDGNCGSACGMFLSVLQQTDSAKVVSVAGIPGYNSSTLGRTYMALVMKKWWFFVHTYTAFIVIFAFNLVCGYYGAPVQQLADVLATMSTFKGYGCNKINTPNDLPLQGEFSTSLIELYNWSPTYVGYEKYKTSTALPLAMTFTPSDFHVPNVWPIDDLDSRDAIYGKAIQCTLTAYNILATRT